jgi:hypothetical protein
VLLKKTADIPLGADCLDSTIGSLSNVSSACSPDKRHVDLGWKGVLGSELVGAKAFALKFGVVKGADQLSFQNVLVEAFDANGSLIGSPSTVSLTLGNGLGGYFSLPDGTKSYAVKALASVPDGSRIREQDELKLEVSRSIPVDETVRSSVVLSADCIQSTAGDLVANGSCSFDNSKASASLSWLGSFDQKLARSTTIDFNLDKAAGGDVLVFDDINVLVEREGGLRSGANCCFSGATE